ncbi:hypothetical protein Pla123a_27770 [Posidoniimonas polymericola]|uniref:Uncharacterized protein n=1 Tax=Posidoniimonas polymericola TaxID=2528002 RepID=A0A5C5YM01_9BACT|nr:hypothetical protein [Posidoniimonas polymericola]TWT75991.1 hypothetical protein Pla123a_27770 [Posidoniimonas polymericola]
MPHRSRVRLTPILACLVLAILLGVSGFLLATARVTGSASLPNGMPIEIVAGLGGFGVGELKSLTRISIAGYEIEFHATDIPDTYSIDVDGVRSKHVVRPGENVSLSTTWSGATLEIGGATLELD